MVQKIITSIFLHLLESDIPQLQQEIKEFTENFDREKDEIVRKAEVINTIPSIA